MIERFLAAVLGLLLVGAQGALAQGVSASSPRGLQHVVVPPAADVKDLQARIAALEAQLRGQGVAAASRPGAGIGDRKAALPPPPEKEEVAFAPAAIAAGPAAAGLATGGLGLPALGVLAGAALGAAFAAGGGGGSATTAAATR
ncbi:MAG: hypothetical protein SNJ73_01670 [Acetobacteraceae bacterium]